MRDLFFFPLFSYVLCFVFTRPYIGVCLWIWTALLLPNLNLFGFASNFRYNLIVAVVTLLAVLFSQDKFNRLNNALFYAVSMLIFWFILTSQLALNLPEIVNHELTNVIKIYVLFTITIVVISTKHRLNCVIIALLLGIGYYITVEGLKFITSGGGHQAFGPGRSIIGDNNHFALAVLMCLPFSVYLARNFTENKPLKWLLICFSIGCFITVVATYSRGGFIGLVVFSMLYGVYFKKKGLVAVFIVLALSFSAVIVPDKWANRMDSIKSASTKDNSFLGRVAAWKLSAVIALDRPLVGGGFKAAESFAIKQMYLDDFHKLNFIYTPPQEEEKARAAHSIYFQVLGEHGFVGLFFFSIIILYSLRLTKKTLNLLKRHKENIPWLRDLALAIRSSIIVYCVSGAALNMAYFDLIYLIFALSYVQYLLAKNELATIKETQLKTQEVLV